jgi:PAS domain S-box-containing protein
MKSKIAPRKAAEEALAQNQVRLKLLNSILACMASGSGVGETLVRILRRIAESFPDRQVIYSIIDPDGLLTVVCSAEPVGWPSLTGHALDLNGAPEVLAALRRRESLVLNDLNSSLHGRAFGPTLVNQGLRAFFALPLKQSSDELGLLSLCAREPHDWTAHEIVTLQQIAEHLFLAFRHDDAERKRRLAEQMLAHERELLWATLRSTADGAITTDVDGKIALINKVAEELTGWRWEALGRKIIEVFDLVDEQTRDRLENPVEKVLQTKSVLDRPVEALLLGRDEMERTVLARAAPIFDADGQVSGAVLVFQDVTEKQKLEAEMVKASRIESLGLLAGGIAHDFNNIMTGILGNISLARMFAPAEPKLQRRLEQAEKACLRARDLTQQLLAFAKGGNLLKRTASMSQLIDEAAELALRGSNVRSAIGFVGGRSGPRSNQASPQSPGSQCRRIDAGWRGRQNPHGERQPDASVAPPAPGRKIREDRDRGPGDWHSARTTGENLRPLLRHRPAKQRIGTGHGLFDHQEAWRHYPGGIRAGSRHALRGFSPRFDSSRRGSKAGAASASFRFGENSGHG